MGVRFPIEAFGVKIIYVRDHATRTATSVLTGGRNVWMLLPDGRVGTNDADFFRWAFSERGERGLRVAERLWRLGKMPKVKYNKLAATVEAQGKRKHQVSVASDLKASAKQLGIELTKEQQKIIDKLAA